MRVTQSHLDASDDFTRTEGLGDVVVSAHLEPEDAVDLIVARGAEEHRSPVTFGAHATADLCAVHARQADIKDDRVRVLIAHGDEPTHTIGFDGNDITRAFEVEPQDIGDRRLVLDDEDERLAIGGRQGGPGMR